MTRLEAAWPMARAWKAGIGFLSPRAIRSTRGVLWLGLAAGVLVVVGAPITALTQGGPQIDALGVLIATVLALVLSPLLIAFFVGYIFYAAHVLRWTAMLLELVGSLVPFGLGASRATVGALLVRAIEWGLLPRIALDEPPPMKAAQEGTLLAPLVLHNVRDGLGWMERADAWLEPFEVQTTEGVIRVLPTAGSVVFTMSYYRALAAAGGVEASAPDTRDLPVWAQGWGRSAKARSRTIPAGRPVRIIGGVRTGDRLEGTPESPVHLEIS